MTVTLKQDPRYDKITNFLKSSGVITTGIHSTEGNQSDGEDITVAEIASAAEFGLGQPMRSWLRAWFDENKSEIEAQLGKQMRAAMAQGKTFEWAAQRVAVWLQADIQRNISRGINPPNSELTIANKGSSTPLIDTGLFRSSIVSYFKGRAV